MRGRTSKSGSAKEKREAGENERKYGSFAVREDAAQGRQPGGGERHRRMAGAVRRSDHGSGSIPRQYRRYVRSDERGREEERRHDSFGRGEHRVQRGGEDRARRSDRRAERRGRARRP